MRLPDWLEPLIDAPGMRATDAWAINDCGVPSLELMENAGRGIAALAAATAPAGAIVVVAGKGNNGGDGFVAARHLREAGRDVDVLVAGDPREVAGDARHNLDLLPGDAARPFAAPLRADAALIIDALLGTGASGSPHGAIAGAIEAIRASGIDVLSTDVPSGVDASSGAVAGIAVTAVATGSFHIAKPGLWIEPGRSHAGSVQVLDIGIPTGGPAEPDVGLIADALLATIPRRDGHSNKFTSGHVVVLGGSTGLTGAPSLTALAAQRAGAGYVTVCVPASLATIFETRLLEAMTISLPDSDGAHTADGAAPVLAAIERGGALVIGPGLGRTAGAAALAQTLIAKASVPVVLDADGLNAFAGQLGLLATSRAGATVLTPHEGELARLLGQTITEVAAERLRSVRAAARESGAVVVLKGSDTLVAEPGGLVAVSRSAPPALATAGTGDVLAGVVGALLAKGLEPFPAAATAVRVHALAGERAAAAHGAEGVIASDVIDQLAAVISL